MKLGALPTQANSGDLGIVWGQEKWPLYGVDRWP